MRVNHRRAQLLVTKQFLHGANVISIFEQVRRERVPKRVTGGRFVYSGLPPGEGFTFWLAMGLGNSGVTIPMLRAGRPL
jgi:hypothetical protein